MNILPTIALQRLPSGRFIMKYDASMLGESNCYQKVWFKLIRGLVVDSGTDRDFKMEYGTGFHKAMQVWYSGGGMEKAVMMAVEFYSRSTIPDSDFRSVAHLALCIQQYIQHYKREGELLQVSLSPEDKPLLEQRFSYPYLSTPIVDVLLEGTMDFIGLFANEYRVIVDHKTTALTYPEQYLNSYVLSYQLMTYKMIWELLFPGQPIQCMINGVFLNRTNKNIFRRSQLFDFNPNQISAHRRFLDKTIRHVVSGFENWYIQVARGQNSDLILDQMFSPNYTCCNEQYGMCEFLPICMSDNRENQEGIIQTSYAKRTYDPSKFQS